MTLRTPPVAATWLLLRLGTRNYAESLAGDLFERYQNGRNSGWYWRQVALAIALAQTEWLRSVARKFIDAAIALFALLALGAGTLAWANAVKHPPSISPQACSTSLQAKSTDCDSKWRGQR
jgi:hypothetical protein